jgi:uncharacterized protein with von Willebrand factor type A (vWA) domain
MAEPLDAPGLAAAFGRRLRAAGLPVTPEHATAFARGLALVRPRRRSELYWTARATFTRSREHVPAFDAVFAAVFDGVVDPGGARGQAGAPPPIGAEPGPRPPAPGPVAATPGEGGVLPRLAAAGDRSAGEGPAREAPLALASAEERLSEKRFADLEPHELAEVRRLMARLELATPLRRTRRMRHGLRGRHVDVRRTVRASVATGGDPVRLARRRRRERPRRLVLLCDISGSMEPYARAYLQFLESAAGGGAHAEAFVFATRLTRLTRALRSGAPDAAIRAAAAAAPDWSGGTRIGAALRAFNDGWGRRGLARGAVVVVLSDGWERDDPALVEREMARLSRLAHRIVWVNPRAAAPGFAPLAGGMAAALPYCDALVSGHSLAALDAVADAIGID